MLRIVPPTVPRVGRSDEHFPDGFELHLLPFSRFLVLSPYRSRRSCPFLPRIVSVFPILPDTSVPSSRGGMTDRPRSAAHPTVCPTSPSTPTAPTTPATTPTAPAAHNTLPSLSRPARLLGAPVLEPRAALLLSGPLRLRAAPCTPYHVSLSPPPPHRSAFLDSTAH